MNVRMRIYRQDRFERVEKMREGRVPKQALWYRAEGRRESCRRWNSEKPEQAIGLMPELKEETTKEKIFTVKEVMLKITFLMCTTLKRIYSFP
jgi:hypothetical protein